MSDRAARGVRCFTVCRISLRAVSIRSKSVRDYIEGRSYQPAGDACGNNGNVLYNIFKYPLGTLYVMVHRSAPKLLIVIRGGSSTHIPRARFPNLPLRHALETGANLPTRDNPEVLHLQQYATRVLHALPTNHPTPPAHATPPCEHVHQPRAPSHPCRTRLGRYFLKKGAFGVL